MTQTDETTETIQPPTQMVCPACQSNDVEVLVRRYESYQVRALEAAPKPYGFTGETHTQRLVLDVEPYETVDEELDQEAKCLDCGHNFDLEAFGVGQDFGGVRFDEKAAKSPTRAALQKALRAYERAEEHNESCQECDDYPCGTGMEFYSTAYQLRRATLIERKWRPYDLGLRADMYPLTSDV